MSYLKVILSRASDVPSTVLRFTQTQGVASGAPPIGGALPILSYFRIRVYIVCCLVNRSTIMKMLKLTTFSVCTMLALSSCGKKEEAAAPADAAKTADAPVATTDAPQAKYKIKSGIVTTEMDNPLGGGKIQTILYFDDYGAKEATETKNETTMMGVTIKTHDIEINRDGYRYKLDLEKKTGTKFKMPNMSSGIASFASMSAADLASDMAKEYNIKKEPSQTIAGKECDVYSMDNKTRQMKGTVASFQGIPMKVDQEMMGMKIKSEVVKFEENVALPAGIFDVPAGVKVEEVSMTGAPVTTGK
jgi:outer membrane lipoprotein-sorting protein